MRQDACKMENCLDGEVTKMKEMKDVKALRCRAHDTQWLFAFDAAVRTLDCVVEELPDRIKEIDAAFELDEARILARRVCTALVETYPEEKRAAIERQLPYLYFRIDVGRPLDKKSNTIIDVDDLGTLINHAHDMHCKLCDHPNRCNTCKLGRVFDRCLPETRGKHESWAEIMV